MSKIQRVDNKEDTKSSLPGAIRPSSPKKRRFRHGIYFWLKTGQVNPSIRGYRKIQKYLMDLEKQLIQDAGGQENLTAAREILVRTTIRAYGVVLLSELFISKYSVLRPDKAKRGILEYQPIIERSYWGAQAQIRQNLLALGLDRMPLSEPSLADVIREFDKENAKKVKAEKRQTEMIAAIDQGQASEDGEIVKPEANGEEIPGS
jgi:hypothetical protein